MTKKISITFFVKSDKKKTDGTAPIYARLTNDSGKTSFATGKYISPDRWSCSSQLKLARKEDDQLLKMELNKVRKEILDIAGSKTLDGKYISVDKIKKQWQNPVELDNRKQTLLELFKLHNAKFWDFVGANERSPESFKKYKSVQYHLIQFILFKYNAEDILVANLNLEFIREFSNYLRRKGISHNTTLKYCQFLSAMLTTAIEHNWIDKKPFSGFKYRFDEVETRYLTEEQIMAIAAKEFSSERLRIVRDIFIFTCLTSYSPVDIRNLTHNDIHLGIDGKKWIRIKRHKTKIPSNVPLLLPALSLIEKYKNHSECTGTNRLFPKRSSSKMNEYLKEIGAICNISFDLHHLVGRHSFATLMISKKVTMESVSKMMGHKRIQQTMHYAQIVANKVGAEMNEIEPLLDFPTTSICIHK